jgi:hypothetical protein
MKTYLAIFLILGGPPAVAFYVGFFGLLRAYW